MKGEEGHEGIWMESRDAQPGAERSRTAIVKGHAHAIWRLFFIQSSRNERTLDGLGLFAVIAPFLRRWSPRAEEARANARRHLGYFNAGLYLSSMVAGVVVNMEGRRSRGESVTAEGIDRTAEALSSVLAARANYFFDSLLIPLGLTIASISAIYESYIGLAIFLVLYNVYHLQSRIGGYCRGVELGEGVDGAFVSRMFREERLVAGCFAFASGIFAALLFVRARAAGGADFIIWGFVAIACTIALEKRLSRMWSVTAMLCATALYLVVQRYVISRFR